LATSPLKRPATLTPGRHLAPTESLASISTPADLHVELVLSEPEIAQPLALRFDNRGRLWVVEYRQYPFPAGLKMLSRDKYYRATYDRLPSAPPNHDRGHDRISIHTDTDGNGTFDQHQTFVDQLNVASSLEIAADGVWVLNPPYLLFYPDRNHDDRPDSDPEIHLSGFGLEDVHSVANSLCWGPDGWLYGAQGSTTSSHVSVTGSDAPPVYRDGAMVWRYHPQQHRYEVFAEGGGNSFGLEINARGHLFTGHNGGSTRGFHYLPGAYMQKGTDNKYGPLSNPFAYDPLPAMHTDTEIPRFSHDLIQYQSTALPDRYQNKIFAVDPLHQHVVVSDIKRRGSTFETSDIDVALRSTDLAFRPVEIVVGPDGWIYVADFCEEFIAHGQHYQGQVDPSTGRVFRIRAADSATTSAELTPLHIVRQLDQATPEQLRDWLSLADRSIRRRALRRLASLQVDHSFVAESLAMLRRSEMPAALELLWLLHQWDPETSTHLQESLRHAEPDVRRWAVRLLGERNHLGADVVAALVELAASDPDIDVRAQLACTARRLDARNCLAIVTALLKHDD
ncbi:MAG: HEAT repeat domain-containing protein, partial [Planctomycetales bacterium]|nr:HEAT repeat domain-containing protein [Planctomycetales bacterium]